VAFTVALTPPIMAVVDLLGTSQPRPTPPRRRTLTAAVVVAGFLISIPIFTIAAVAGFAQGWQGAPRVMEGENIIELIHHRRHSTGHLPTSNETE
jgi:hypothetical protein